LTIARWPLENNLNVCDDPYSGGCGLNACNATVANKYDDDDDDCGANANT